MRLRIVLILICFTIFAKGSILEYKILSKPKYYDMSKDSVDPGYFTGSINHGDILKKTNPEMAESITNDYKKYAKYSGCFRLTFSSTFSIYYAWRTFIEYSLLISDSDPTEAGEVLASALKIAKKRPEIFDPRVYVDLHIEEYYHFAKGSQVYYSGKPEEAIKELEIFLQKYISDNEILVYSGTHSEMLFFLDTVYYLILSYKNIDQYNFIHGIAILEYFKDACEINPMFQEVYDLWSNREAAEQIMEKYKNSSKDETGTTNKLTNGQSE